MKKLLYLFLITLISQSIIGQDCSPFQNTNFINLNNFNGGNTDYNFNQILLNGYDEINGRINLDSSKNIIFAQSLWVAGITDNEIFQVAGNTYPSQISNYDIYPGPLDENGQTFSEQCKFWDQIFKVTKNEVREAINIIYNEDGSLNENMCEKLPKNILLWPAKGNEFLSPFTPDEMADFFDADLDGLYNPCKGDLPVVIPRGCEPSSLEEILSGYPEIIYFKVSNDAGGPHTLSGGEPLHVEIHQYLFGYLGSELFENAIFFKNKIINKGPNDYKEFYASNWTDSDLGCAFDDYSGTYSDRDLVYFYNEDAIDGDLGMNCSGGVNTINPVPMVGITLLKGFADENGNNTGITSSFMSFNCSSNPPDPSFCDPESEDLQFYNVITGKKRTGEPIIINGDTIKYMYNGNPINPSDNTMCSTTLTDIDVRNIFTTGGTRLNSGASNEMVGAIYLSYKANLPCPDLNILLEEQDKIEYFYSNCFNKTNGIDAPVLKTNRLYNSTEFKIENPSTSNNYNESYRELILGAPSQTPDYEYVFEGYKVYQVVDKNMDLSLLEDPAYSVLVYQTDVNNDISEIKNWDTQYDDQNQKNWVQELKVEGNNNGIETSFSLDFDYIEGKPIERNKEYYYVAIAYAHNEYEAFDPLTEAGQHTPYIQSFGNVKITVAQPALDNNDLAPVIKRLSGQGNMNSCEVDSETVLKILSDNDIDTIIYKVNKGPFDIYVIDKDKASTFGTLRLEINGPWNDNSNICGFNLDSTYLEITDQNTGGTIISEYPLSETSDHVFEDIGILVSIGKMEEPGDNLTSRNGVINQKIIYKDDLGPKWLGNMFQANVSQVDIDLSQHKIFEEIGYEIPFYGKLLYPLLSGGFCYSNVENLCISPTNDSKIRLLQEVGGVTMNNLNNIDIVLTSNKELWSKCIVVETGSFQYERLSTSMNSYRFLHAKDDNPSIDKDGNIIPGETGMSWFPGYAIDLETGRRLNIFFGENTFLTEPDLTIQDPNMSNDMIWNPSDEVLDSNGSLNDLHRAVLGGQHFIYVSNTTYDECTNLKDLFSKSSYSPDFRDLASLNWTIAPMLNEGEELLSMADGLIPNDVTISARVNNSFQQTKIIDKTDDVQKCITDGKNPVYQFNLTENPNYTEDNPSENRSVPWQIITQFNNFIIKEIKEDVVVDVIYANGNLKNTFKLNKGDELQDGNRYLGQENGLYIIRIRSRESGVARSYKVMVVG